MFWLTEAQKCQWKRAMCCFTSLPHFYVYSKPLNVFLTRFLLPLLSAKDKNSDKKTPLILSFWAVRVISDSRITVILFSPCWTICTSNCQLECFSSVSVFSLFGHGSDLMSTKQIRFHCHGTDINSESTEILTNPGHTRHWLHIRVMLQIKNFVFNLGKWRHF